MTDYPSFVRALYKDPVKLIQDLHPVSAHALHMAVGISGESGELLDAVKKYAVYNKPLDLVNVVEELGDLEFYMEGLRQGLGITREATITANVTKLSRRYTALTYSDNAAINRADKDD